MSYATIVADPPWHYDRRVPGFTQGRGYLPRHPFPYATMTLPQIEALPVAELADPAGCRLFCWATNRYLHAAFHVVKAWGFTERQTLIWRKTGNPPPLRAHLAPNSAEFLIVATVGKPPRLSTLASSVLDAPVGEHSAKPEMFLDIVEQVSPGPYLELFARRNRLGWDTWGNESLEHVEVPA